ncbi:MAG: 6-phosphogluconolactonase [Gallionellaceae bacterium]
MPSLNHRQTTQICRWHPYDNALELEQAALNEILRAAQQAIKDRGAFHIVLAGGTTPRRVYEALREAKTEWHAWHVYYGDERCLPSEHAERNSRMAALAWLDHVAIPTTQIHPIRAEESASVAAEKYARVVTKVGLFDLVLLGLGEDGHTASLFPDHEWGSNEDAQCTLAVLDAPKPPPQRVSLSAHRLSEAHQVIFLVTGISKAEAVKNWRAGISIPAAAITPGNGVDIYAESGLLD